MTTLQTLSSLIAAAFPDFQLEWVAKEFRKNLIQEFDFTNEAKNCEMTAARFAYRAADVRCPEIRWDLTSRRVLTMEFIHGVKVNNVPAIRSLGLDPADVRSVLSQAFAEMIFCHGVLHCDPHPGNAFIVRSPARPDKPQLVILDHGLYRYISDEFRLLYCQLWKALVLGDVALLRDVSARLGVPQYADYFPLIFTNRVMGSASLLGESVSKEDRARLRQQFKDTTLAQVLVFLESLPREILLASRVSNLIRGIHQELGGENIERFSDNATYAILGSYFSTSKPVRDALTAERLDTRGAARSRVVAFQLTARIDSFTDRIRFWRDLAWLRVRLWLGQSFVLTLRWLRSWNLA
nr:hypothetical protein HK105_000816 [Polyrhizophydium stewartii]